jgi:hypothetical protein
VLIYGRSWMNSRHDLFSGVDMDADFGRPSPVLVPNIWADLMPVGVPGRVGIALAVVLG